MATEVKPEVIHLTDDSSRADIERAIAALKAKHDRLPAHYEEQRAAIMAEIEADVDRWLAAGG